MIAALALAAAAAAQAGPVDPVCGDGVIEAPETCDDASPEGGDGCDAACMTEPGWACTGAPSECAGICGDGLVRDVEDCDDGGVEPGDGCDAACASEPGYSCSGEPSVCVESAVCGDGTREVGEQCDDANLEVGDGCDNTCSPEREFWCEGELGETSTCGADADEDEVWDELDNCPEVPNISQRDEDDDGVGDKCEPEVDDGCAAGGGDVGVLVMIAIVLPLTICRRRLVA